MVAFAATVISLSVMAPEVVRWQVEHQAAALWPGRVTIDHVRLLGVPRIELRGVTVRDAADVAVAELGSVAIVVRRLGWTGPKAARLTIDGIGLRSGTAPGYIPLPLALSGVVATARGGGMHLAGGRIAYRDVTVVDELAADLAPDGSGLALDGPTGRILGVPFTVKRGAPDRPADARAIATTVSAAGIPVAALAPLLPADERLRRGHAGVAVTLQRDPGPGWSVAGHVHLTEADLRGVSLARKLSHFLGIKDLSPLTTAEAEIAFTMTGTSATVTHGHLASGLPEMAIEPGGRVDLATGQIDASLVLAAGARLDEVPLLHPVGTLVKHLTRVRIHGHWRDPEETLFSRD